MAKKVKLEPVDRARCQTEWTDHGPFRMGPPDKFRCEEVPVWVAYENKPGPDGQKGAMSLCEKHRKVFEEVTPKGLATLRRIRGR